MKQSRAENKENVVMTGHKRELTTDEVEITEGERNGKKLKLDSDMIIEFSEQVGGASLEWPQVIQ